MKRAFFAIAGIILVLLSFTLLSSFGFDFLAATYIFALYLLFFRKNDLAIAFLIGTTLAVELLGNAHFGNALLLCILWLFLEELFGKRLRFTSLFNRFCLSMIIALASYSLLLFSFTDLLPHLLNLIILSPLLMLLTYYLATLGRTQRYELL